MKASLPLRCVGGAGQGYKGKSSDDSHHASLGKTIKCPVDGKELFYVLENAFGFKSFRGQQQLAIEAVLSGSDCFCLMPTGGGKSLCYQIPALLKPGITLVVSPLIALMENQVAALKARKIAAEYLSSTQSTAVKNKVSAELASGKPGLRLLYVTPELIATDQFLAKLHKLHGRGLLSLIAIDEAHCISSWGHDFRPSYRRLSVLRDSFSGVPILALTATATKKVRTDILNSLRLHQPVVAITSFNRPNIRYEVRYVKTVKIQDVNDDLCALVKSAPDDCTIIYCRARSTCDSVASMLAEEGILCRVYHAGMRDGDRSQALEDWASGRVPVVIATVAFGMGIDRADVRLVVHYNIPKTMEGFYQESGRAGRDGKTARSILYYSTDDKRSMAFIISKSGEEKKGDKGRRDEMLRHATEAFSKMAKYCETACCRRRMLLAHFGEEVSPSLCNRTCDACQFPGRVQDCLQQLEDQGGGSHFRGGGIIMGDINMGKGGRASGSEFENRRGESDEDSISDSDDSGSDGEREAKAAAKQAARKAKGGQRAKPEDKLNALAKAEAAYNKRKAQSKGLQSTGVDKKVVSEASRESARKRLHLAISQLKQKNPEAAAVIQDTEVAAAALEQDNYNKYGKRGHGIYTNQLNGTVRCLNVSDPPSLRDRIAGLIGSSKSTPAPPQPPAANDSSVPPPAVWTTASNLLGGKAQTARPSEPLDVRPSGTSQATESAGCASLQQPSSHLSSIERTSALDITHSSVGTESQPQSLVEQNSGRAGFSERNSGPEKAEAGPCSGIEPKRTDDQSGRGRIEGNPNLGSARMGGTGSRPPVVGLRKPRPILSFSEFMKQKAKAGNQHEKEKGAPDKRQRKY